MAMANQWRVGPGGAIGLDLAALPVVEERLGLPRQAKLRRRCFADLLAMQEAVLAAWAKRREEQSQTSASKPRG